MARAQSSDATALKATQRLVAQMISSGLQIGGTHREFV
jgi:hypothetical protein